MACPCPKCVRKRELNAAAARRWRERNPLKVVEVQKSFYERHRLSQIAKRILWGKKNPEKQRAIVSSRQKRLKIATPSWLTKAHWQEIRNFYQAASELRWLSNEPLQVDHIVPLKGKDVCGLHVPWNLQILPASENLRKRNKF